MKFILESMKIRNFKGIKEQDIDFNEESTTICGENGTGKTTVVDAFTWLLFEKDSKSRSQFEIKTLEDGEVIHGLEHSVQATFKVDGKPLKLKKIYKEKWTKRRGDEQKTFTGHEVERFVNDIPSKKNEYDKKINELIDENIFKLLTDPFYFSQQLDWKQRRNTLFSLSDEIEKEDIFKNHPGLKLIEKDLEDKTVDELKKTLSYQRRQLNKDRDNIPVKIETLNSTIKEVDQEVLDLRIRGIKGSIARIEENMLDASKVDEERLKKQDKLYELKSKLKEIEFEIKNNIENPDEAIIKEIRELKNKKGQMESDLFSMDYEMSKLKTSIQRDKEYVEALRKDYNKAQSKRIQIDENINKCPTCKRDFEEAEIQEKISELEENFKENQVKTLKEIRENGQYAKKELEENEKRLQEVKVKHIDLYKGKSDIEEAISDLENRLGKSSPDINKLLEENQEYKNHTKMIRKLEEELKNKPNNNISEMKEKKSELESQLKEMEKDLHQDEINKNTKQTINNLMEEEKDLSQKINDVERKENTADKFIAAKAEMIEKNLNEKFEEVSFRLFKKQVNGSLDETCEVLVDGVPFYNANTAGQVNAGLDVINSLCSNYDIYTPIFIDNRESVNELIDTKSQLINLKVTKHKNLRVENE